MGKFLMLCHVAADFIGPDGLRFRVTKEKINIFLEAPVWIKDTLIYRLLLKDGSIVVADTKQTAAVVENNPLAGVNAEGKTVVKTEPVEVKADTRAKRKPRKKDDAE